MNIQHFINNIGDQDRSHTGFHFELIIQNLLKSHLDKQKKSFAVEYILQNKIRVDGYAQNGIDQYEGPVAFEIKYGRNMTTVGSKRTFDYLKHILEATEVEYVILICPEISIRLSSTIEKESNIFFWDSNKINELISENVDIFENTTNNLFKLGIERKIAQNDDDWKKTRLGILSDIKKTYKKEGISLLLGAGVSCSAGFPDWKTLLNSLYSNYVSDVFLDKPVSDSALQAITDKFIDINNTSTLATARYLKAGLSHNDNESSFIEAVRKALYTSIPSSSPLVNSIIGLCTPKRSGAKVKSIITYNFDNLIEENMDKIQLEYKAICKDEEQYSMDELPIYHVHGYIPPESDINKDTYLVFSEEAYHKVYSEPYHWSNLVQLSTLRDNSCLMIGLSLSDPNLRRLLEIATPKHSKNSRHYVFMQRLNITSIIEKNNKGEVGEISANKILKIHHTIQETMMSSLGANIIWFEDYKEIPTLLGSINK